MHATSAKSEPVHRRTLLGYFIGAIGAFIGTALGIPIAGYVISPALQTREGKWVEAGSPTDFPLGVPKLTDFTLLRQDGWLEEAQKKSIWVLRRSDTEFIVYNPRCTHLGCAFNWMPDKQQFFCPCHAGVFDSEGKVISGPPPRALDRLSYKLENGKLLVQYTDFRLGVPDKAEA